MGMSSINTNISAMTALQSLQQTSKDLLTTQNRISTGLKVASASDNAAYWSIATTRIGVMMRRHVVMSVRRVSTAKSGSMMKSGEL